MLAGSKSPAAAYKNLPFPVRSVVASAFDALPMGLAVMFGKVPITDALFPKSAIAESARGKTLSPNRKKQVELFAKLRAKRLELAAKEQEARPASIERGSIDVEFSKQQQAQLADDNEPISSQDLEVLWNRIASIDDDENKAQIDDIMSHRVEHKLYNVVTKKHPLLGVRQFKLHAPKEVTALMEDEVANLVGRLPKEDFGMTFNFTQEQLMTMMLQLQETGYMHRNAIYVVGLRDALGLRTQFGEELREIFAKLDRDRSNYIEPDEAKRFLCGDCPGDCSSCADECDRKVAKFYNFFDADKDGRISIDEFDQMMSGSQTKQRPSIVDTMDQGESEPAISGNVTLTFPDGSTKEMTMTEYVAKLKAERKALVAKLLASQLDQQQSPPSFAEYVRRLPDQQYDRLTTGTMTNEVRNVMKRVAQETITSGRNSRSFNKKKLLQFRRKKFETIAFSQLIVGYHLRQLESIFSTDWAEPMAKA